MKSDKSKSLKMIVLFTALVACISTCNATVSFSGKFYTSDHELDIEEINDNAISQGTISLLPFDDNGESSFSIRATGKGCSNGGSGEVKHSSSISASGKERTVNSEFTLSEDSALRGTLTSTWDHEVLLGSECSLQLSADIKSKPGFLTYPTAPSRDSISAGITLESFSNSGLPLFDKKFVPPPEFGDFPLVLGVMKSPKYPNVYMENILDIRADW